jgi:hypothetical protein
MQLTFVHVTARRHLASIVANGLRPGSYFSHADQVAVRENLVANLVEAGDEPVFLSVDPSALDVRELAADVEAIEHPFPSVLAQMSQEELRDRWDGCGQTWRDSVELVGTCRHMAAIPARFLSVDGVPLAAEATPQPRRMRA